MIRIKAPRVAVGGEMAWHISTRSGRDKIGRLYSESMHRRVVALVRACEMEGRNEHIMRAIDSLAAQAEKEAKIK